ncbi:hypothetical protein KC321_g10 [Hortaea werneckii]|nr:hypothetical protein KC321_g10 [Hortaea werneckii]
MQLWQRSNMRLFKDSTRSVAEVRCCMYLYSHNAGDWFHVTVRSSSFSFALSQERKGSEAIHWRHPYDRCQPRNIKHFEAGCHVVRLDDYFLV